MTGSRRWRTHIPVSVRSAIFLAAAPNLSPNGVLSAHISETAEPGKTAIRFRRCNKPWIVPLAWFLDISDTSIGTVISGFRIRRQPFLLDWLLVVRWRSRRIPSTQMSRMAFNCWDEKGDFEDEGQ